MTCLIKMNTIVQVKHFLYVNSRKCVHPDCMLQNDYFMRSQANSLRVH